VEALPYIGVSVELILIEVPVHSDVSECVSDLWRVVIRNRREGVEKIGVNTLGLGHSVPLLLLGFLLVILHVGLHYIEVEGEDAWVKQEVGAVAHAAKGAQSVGSVTHRLLVCFIK